MCYIDIVNSINRESGMWVIKKDIMYLDMNDDWSQFIGHADIFYNKIDAQSIARDHEAKFVDVVCRGGSYIELR